GIQQQRTGVLEAAITSPTLDHGLTISRILRIYFPF
ncbi:MAG: hypothetical protein QOH57_3556, partial [Mycobacterium sp.]|nr:hypothetical protein [Mycobacterium sp.]